MRTYYMAFLRKGPAWSAEEDARVRGGLRGAHGQHQPARRVRQAADRLPVREGQNPQTDDLAGIFIFDVPTFEEAVALTQTDPAVKAGRFAVEVRPWYGPAGLTYDGHEPPKPGCAVRALTGSGAHPISRSLPSFTTSAPPPPAPPCAPACPRPSPPCERRPCARELRHRHGQGHPPQHHSLQEKSTTAANWRRSSPPWHPRTPAPAHVPAAEKPTMRNVPVPGPKKPS